MIIFIMGELVIEQYPQLTSSRDHIILEIYLIFFVWPEISHSTFVCNS